MIKTFIIGILITMLTGCHGKADPCMRKCAKRHIDQIREYGRWVDVAVCDEWGPVEQNPDSPERCDKITKREPTPGPAELNGPCGKNVGGNWTNLSPAAQVKMINDILNTPPEPTAEIAKP